MGRSTPGLRQIDPVCVTRSGSVLLMRMTKARTAKWIGVAEFCERTQMTRFRFDKLRRAKKIRTRQDTVGAKIQIPESEIELSVSENLPAILYLVNYHVDERALASSN